MQLTNFISTRRLTKDIFSNNPDLSGALGFITVDGYSDENVNETFVVCTVYFTEAESFIIHWDRDGYRTNQTVQNLIKEAKTWLKQTCASEKQTENKNQQEATPLHKLVIENSLYINDLAIELAARSVNHRFSALLMPFSDNELRNEINLMKNLVN